VITTGNHVWDKKEAIDLLKNDERILRPLNFPHNTPGRGHVKIRHGEETQVMIVNLQGRVFMEPVADNPFVAIDVFLKNHKADIIIVDFHAEATAEKQALGFFLNGRVSAVLCTHTHIQTADLRILSKGTAYQTDVGMTGSIDSIIGMKMDPIINKFLTGINHRFEVAKKNLVMDVAILDINPQTGKAVNVESLRLHESTYEEQLSQESLLKQSLNS